MEQNETISYYNLHAKAYALDTVSADMTPTYGEFLHLLPKQSFLLDFGCGAGRDAKAFSDMGYRVEAVDGSKELCVIAAAHTGLSVKQLRFEELSCENSYDGIWACASILHLPQKELALVFCRMRRALKENGVLYASFKYGEFEGVRNGRYFTYFTEPSFAEFLRETGTGFRIEKQWTTGDVRPGRGREPWLNLLLRKTEYN